MSGGCHFVGNCERFKTGCGKCPGVKSNKENDFTRWNVAYRKRIYEKVKPIVWGNSYMNTFYRQSFLLKDYNRCEVILPLMDNETYKPLNVKDCRQKYNIPTGKEFLMFVGCQHLDDERKGMKYLLRALEILYTRLSDDERDSVLLVLAGHDIKPIEDSLFFDYVYLGYVKQHQLPELYSMSNVYLSPSVNDAGPSMVNQSLSCGTPVVAFEMGIALDIVKGQDTGYCAELRNVEDFATGIEWIFRMDDNQYKGIRQKCRETALELTSEKAFVNRFLAIYKKYKY
jgi:glycosyltransferase involved in cell wall biosynthesis